MPALASFWRRGIHLSAPRLLAITFFLVGLCLFKEKLTALEYREALRAILQKPPKSLANEYGHGKEELAAGPERLAAYGGKSATYNKSWDALSPASMSGPESSKQTDSTASSETSDTPAFITSSSSSTLSSSSSTAPPLHSTGLKSPTVFCERFADEFPLPSDVLIVLKTGATELYQKLPTHLATTLSCHSNYLLFSEYEQNFGGEHLYDAIESVSPRWKEGHEDFKLYRKISTFAKTGQEVGRLRGDKGWNLDKWKFVPMADRAYRMRPNAKWFVFMEADTYVSWFNTLKLLKWLPDPMTNALYLGCAVSIGGTAFAHGGSMFIVSNDAMRRFSKIAPGRRETWEEQTRSSCCGDMILGVALKEAGVQLTGAYPLIQGETLITLPWAKGMWCEPALSWHHVAGFEVDTLWQFEQEWRRQQTTPILFSDYFHHFIWPHLTSARVNWDNLSKDIDLVDDPEPSPQRTKRDNLEQSQHQQEEQRQLQQQQLDSPTVNPIPDQADQDKEDTDEPGPRRTFARPEDCLLACMQEAECLQWRYELGSCKLHKTVRLGRPLADRDEPDPADTKSRDSALTSGWMLERIEAWVREADGESGCDRKRFAGQRVWSAESKGESERGWGLQLAL